MRARWVPPHKSTGRYFQQDARLSISLSKKVLIDGLRQPGTSNAPPVVTLDTSVYEVLPIGTDKVTVEKEIRRENLVGWQMSAYHDTTCMQCRELGCYGVHYLWRGLMGKAREQRTGNSEHRARLGIYLLSMYDGIPTS